MNIISQIVRLATMHNLSPESTDLELLVWYRYCFDKGQLEYILDEAGTVIGFLDWVRLEEIPKSIEHAHVLFKRGGDKGSIIFVLNCVSKDLRTLLALRRSAMNKTPDREAECYHRKKDDVIFVKRRNQNVYVKTPVE
jgi:hypothetical protein